MSFKFAKSGSSCSRGLRQYLQNALYYKKQTKAYLSLKWATTVEMEAIRKCTTESRICELKADSAWDHGLFWVEQGYILGATWIHWQLCEIWVLINALNKKGRFSLPCYSWQKATLACARLVSLVVPHLPFRSSEYKESKTFSILNIYATFAIGGVIMVVEGRV